MNIFINDKRGYLYEGGNKGGKIKVVIPWFIPTCILGYILGTNQFKKDRSKKRGEG